MVLDDPKSNVRWITTLRREVHAAQEVLEAGGNDPSVSEVSQIKRDQDAGTHWDLKTLSQNVVVTPKLHVRCS